MGGAICTPNGVGLESEEDETITSSTEGEADELPEPATVTCLICQETYPRLATVVLPCSCKMRYCTSCLDRCLASSFNRTNTLECPCCRQNFRADFNSTDVTMSLTLLEEGDPQEEAHLQMSRLYQQSKPRQLELLRQHKKLADPSEKQGPPCVCGGRLARITVEERVKLSKKECEEIDASNWLTLPFVMCDICEAWISPENLVWTCRNGSNTVLHACWYDICEECFATYAQPRLHCLLGRLVSRSGTLGPTSKSTYRRDVGVRRSTVQPRQPGQTVPRMSQANATPVLLHSAVSQTGSRVPVSYANNPCSAAVGRSFATTRGLAGPGVRSRPTDQINVTTF